MKKTISLAAVLLLAVAPASVFGVSMSLSAASLSLDNSAPGQVTIDVNLDPEGLALTGIAYALEAQYSGALSIVSRTLTGTLTDPTTSTITDTALDPINGQDLGSTWDGATAQTADEKTAEIVLAYDVSGYALGETIDLGADF